MKRQNFDTPPADLLSLSRTALDARARRVEELKILVAAGLYKVDAGAIANAILRRKGLSSCTQHAACRSLDRAPAAQHAC